jgi:hypothetical protein
MDKRLGERETSEKMGNFRGEGKQIKFSNEENE